VTSTIPIVFVAGTDPVKDGLITSLARPGGNVTGVSMMLVELTPKRLELMSELVPATKVMALLVNPKNANAERVMRDAQDASRAKGVQLHTVKAGTESEIETAFGSLPQLQVGALVAYEFASLAWIAEAYRPSLERLEKLADESAAPSDPDIHEGVLLEFFGPDDELTN
jgi:hypothetical protein